MKVKFPNPANHGLYSKNKHGKEKRWVQYSDDNNVIVEIEIEVDVEKEKLYNESVTFYDKNGCYIHYVKSKTIDKLV